jgi:hypothetical protein
MIADDNYSITSKKKVQKILRYPEASGPSEACYVKMGMNKETGRMKNG